jgi:hypothetical protein
MSDLETLRAVIEHGERSFSEEDLEGLEELSAEMGFTVIPRVDLPRLNRGGSPCLRVQIKFPL